jgi:hypothetical protein
MMGEYEMFMERIIRILRMMRMMRMMRIGWR